MAGKPDTVKVGSVSIPIYTNARGRYRSFTVAFYRDGKRQRRTFSDKEEAITEARVVARSISSGHVQALDLSISDRGAFHRANERLAPLGVSLDEAIREYIEAKSLLKGQPLAKREFALRCGGSRFAARPTLL